MLRKVIFLFVTLLLLIGCSAEQNTELEESINSVIEDENNQEININSLTTFEWDEAHLFAPYAIKSGMEERLGFKYRDKSNIGMRDDIFLLVFVQDDKAIQYAEIIHQGSNLSMEENNLAPSNDVIYIDRY